MRTLDLDQSRLTIRIFESKCFAVLNTFDAQLRHAAEQQLNAIGAEADYFA